MDTGSTPEPQAPRATSLLGSTPRRRCRWAFVLSLGFPWAHCLAVLASAGQRVCTDRTQCGPGRPVTELPPKDADDFEPESKPCHSYFCRNKPCVVSTSTELPYLAAQSFKE